MTTAELLQQALVGKKLKHRNRYGKDVVLLVEKLENIHKSGSRELEPATQANDWWPATSEWSESYIEITFDDGSVVKFNPNTNFDIVE